MTRSDKARMLLAQAFQSAPGRALKSVARALTELECSLSRRWVAGAHHRLMLVEWGLPPHPMNMDHHIDMYFQWRHTRDALWLERGVFNSLALSGGTVLELTCGDGFNARNFYSLKSAHITACDIDESIIETARSKNSAPNVTFVTADIVNAFPAGRYHNVIWDFGFPITEFFSAEQLNAIFANVKEALEPGGVFSGYTMAEDATNNFTDAGPAGRMVSKEQLRDLLAPFHRNVTVFETVTPRRRNLYYWASDGELPFQSDWPMLCTSQSRAS